MLNVYQFWLDDLYPRAKFADGLTIIEKLGHSKRIQAMRREWINEGKPRSRFEDTDLLQDSRRITKGSETARPDSIATSANQTFENSNMRHPSASAEEDLYKATPPRRKQTTGYDSVIESTSMDQTPPKDADADVPDDDLDILLAETSWTRKRDAPPVLASANQEDATQFSNEDDFDDEMEVMAEMRMNGA